MSCTEDLSVEPESYAQILGECTVVRMCKCVFVRVGAGREGELSHHCLS